MQQTVVETDPLQKALFTQKLDNVLLHQNVGIYYFVYCIVSYYFKVFFCLRNFLWMALNGPLQRQADGLEFGAPSRMVQ